MPTAIASSPLTSKDVDSDIEALLSVIHERTTSGAAIAPVHTLVGIPWSGLRGRSGQRSAVAAPLQEDLVRVPRCFRRRRDAGADRRVVDVAAYLLSEEGHGIASQVIHLDDSLAAGPGPETDESASHLVSLD
jgi:hypothetical protein